MLAIVTINTYLIYRNRRQGLQPLSGVSIKKAILFGMAFY